MLHFLLASALCVAYAHERPISMHAMFDASPFCTDSLSLLNVPAAQTELNSCTPVEGSLGTPVDSFSMFSSSDDSFSIAFVLALCMRPFFIVRGCWQVMSLAVALLLAMCIKYDVFRASRKYFASARVRISSSIKWLLMKDFHRAFPIFVRRAEQTMSNPAHPGMSVSDVKRDVCKKINVLEEGPALSEYKVGNDATLHVSLRMRGGAPCPRQVRRIG